MSNLSELIELAIEIKPGDKEFALSFDGDQSESAWCAEIGNKFGAVRLGEAKGEFCGFGKTPEDAVTILINAIKAANV